MKGTSTRTHDVFISYSRRDQKIAQSVCALLEQQGIRCWVDYRDIPGGESWPGQLVKAITGARVLVMIWSPESNASNQVFREVSNALEAGVTVIPFRISEVEPSEQLKFYFTNINWMDAVTEPIEEHIKRLASRIKGLLGGTIMDLPPPSSSSSSRNARVKWIAPIAIAGVVLVGLAWWKPQVSGSRADRPSADSSDSVRVIADTAPKLSLAESLQNRMKYKDYLDSIYKQLDSGVSKEQLIAGLLVDLGKKKSEFDDVYENVDIDEHCAAVWQLFNIGNILVMRYPDVKALGWDLVDKADDVMSGLTCSDAEAWRKWWVLHGKAYLLSWYKPTNGDTLDEAEKYFNGALVILQKAANYNPSPDWDIYTVLSREQRAQFYQERRGDLEQAKAEIDDALKICNEQPALQESNPGFKAWCEGAIQRAKSINSQR
ncbi:MAG: toll/interleukin-1 receptor domain-containing protein [Xanthomonadales bacterium]|nr:toll/interleukin-1 receptor domain-containing protein [Xanthomonadales bacterium]HRD73258.1 toll/interleukin-1 receptor domain-containing protein [Aquimonas sp.]